MRRRDLLAGMAAFGAAGLLPRFAVAELAVTGGLVRTVSDGNLVLPRSFTLGDLPADQVDAILADYGISGDTFEPPCNVTLFQAGDRTVLFDVGSGNDFMPSAGSLLDSLDAAGVAPGNITDIVFTHGHPDHLWGLLDDFDDPTFPNARYHMGQAEFDYWTDPGTVDTIDQGRQTFAVGAKRRLDEIADQVNFFAGGAEVVPGVLAVSTPGHTPGHMSFEVGGSDSVFVIGDAIANHHVSLARPGWQVGSDQDQEMGAATRAALVDRLASEQRAVIGFHLPFGGMGRIAPSGDGFRFVELDG